MGRELGELEGRKKAIKDLLYKLHAGKTVDEVKQEFEEVFSDVSAFEIAEAEKALVAEGVPVEEIQRLCDVHAAVFKGSIEEIHAPLDFSTLPGHPAHTLKAENRAIEYVIHEKIYPKLEEVAKGKEPAAKLLEDIEVLQRIDKHYLRKENLFFPYLERYGITAPPKVMWGVDDEIRAMLQEAVSLLKVSSPAFSKKLEEALTAIEEMIFKEENILLPMMFDALTLEEWKSIADESDDLGYCLIEKPVAWRPTQFSDASGILQPNGVQDMAAKTAVDTLVEGRAEGAAKGMEAESGSATVTLPTGAFTQKELFHVLNTLPFDITFVGKDDKVRYFSESKERIFTRTRSIIGREVANCHPPASVHVVEAIIDDFKSGKKSHEDFWIRMGDKYVFIRYFAVRDEEGEYLGVLEVTQDIAPLKQITNEKRLLS